MEGVHAHAHLRCNARNGHGLTVVAGALEEWVELLRSPESGDALVFRIFCPPATVSTTYSYPGQTLACMNSRALACLVSIESL